MRIHTLWPTQASIVSLACAFGAERILYFSQTGQFTLHILSLILLVTATVARCRAYWSSDSQGAASSIKARLFVTTFGLLVSILMFHALSASHEDHHRLASILWGIWPALMLLSMALLLAIESTVSPVAYISKYEVTHVKHVFERTLGMCLLLISAFWANFLAAQHDYHWDLSAAASTTPGDITQQTVTELSKELYVYLFWPQTHEVGDVVEHYFSKLTPLNAKLHVTRIDHALAPNEAEQSKVKENGWIAITHHNLYEKIRIGQTSRSSRNQLRRLDQTLTKALLKLSRGKQIVYVTHGHDERTLQSSLETDQRSPLSTLRKQLGTLQFDVRPLGIANGSTEKIPDDASLVLILDPKKPFLDAELAAFNQAANQRLRLLITVDINRSEDVVAPLLAPFNIHYHATPLVNQTSYVRLTQTPADKRYLWTNRFSSHPSVTSMSRSNKLTSIFREASSLSIATTATRSPSLGFNIHSVLNTVDGTFRDNNTNLKLDNEELVENYSLAIAGTKTSTVELNQESRVFVLADTDVFSDQLISHPGNMYLFLDIIRWLQRDDEPIIPTIGERDTRIIHASEHDTLLFYGTVFMMPLLVLLLGYLINRRKAS
ncbi:MAG: Gldg family protein [Myxococcales bacterium]|nr:Gldg family protein [Myxococcales bacterium]